MKHPNITLKNTIAVLAIAGFAISLISLSSAVVSASSGSLNGTKPTMKPPTPTPYCPESYLELQVDKPMVALGELFTLTVKYYYIGLYEMGVNLQPPDIAVFNPAVTFPCWYHCPSFSLQAVSPGRLEISAGAYGEAYCNGWVYKGAKSKTPAVVWIVPQVLRYYLPMVGK